MLYTFNKTVNTDKLQKEILVSNLSSIYSYITTKSDPIEVTIYFTQSLSAEQIVSLQTIVTNHTTAPSPEEYIQSVIQSAITFGQQLVVSFAAENVLMGITQAGKTKQVADYLTNVLRYMQSGSLYEALNEVTYLQNQGIPQDLAPFVTQTRLVSFKNKIETYLGIPLSE